MHTTSITIRNNQKLEIFVKNRSEGFELWMVTPVEGCRMVLDHRLTHDDLQTRLEYAARGDLVWRDARISEIPTQKHQSAIQMEDTIKRSTFVDFESELHQPLAYHFASTTNLIPLDRKQWDIAQKAILGEWTDGVATVNFKSDNKLDWSCQIEQPHPFNTGVRIHNKQIPDWWSFARWQLHLMNDEHKSGMRIGVLRVDEQELHVWNENHPRRLAHIFHRNK